MLKNVIGLRTTIVFVIAFFLLAINIFQTRSENLKLETRFLYSNEALEIHSDFHSASEILRIYSDPYRIYGILSKHQDVRVFYSNCFEAWTPPLYDGRFFNQANTSEAIVGRLIADDDGYVYFSGNYYRIIGRLGVSGTNLLDNTIILNNTALFSQTVSPYLVIDGDGATDAISAISQSTQHEPFFRGADQMRLEVDFLTPTVALWGRFLGFLGSCLLALFYFDQKKDLLKTKYLIGNPILTQYLCLAMFFLLYIVPYMFSVVFLTMFPSMQVNLLRYSWDIVGSLLISYGTFLICGVRFSFRFKNRIPA